MCIDVETVNLLKEVNELEQFYVLEGGFLLETEVEEDLYEDYPKSTSNERKHSAASVIMRAEMKKGAETGTN